MGNVTYGVLPDDDIDRDDSTQSRDVTSRKPALLLSPYPWMLSTAVLLSLLVLTIARNAQQGNSFARGFDTELSMAFGALDQIQVRFNGDIKYTEAGEIYMDYGDTDVRYFGKPSPAIDQAWLDLIGDNMVISITEEEARKLEQPSYNHPTAGIIVGPDTPHSLHCVNEIRKLLDPDYYFNSTIQGLRKMDRIHTEHCLNHIRQLIQCHMDITPITHQYLKEVDSVVGNFNQLHTCRNISKMRQWSKQQYSYVTLPWSALYPKGSKVPFLGYPETKDAALPWGLAHEGE